MSENSFLNNNLIIFLAITLVLIATLLVGGFLYLEIVYSFKFLPNTKIAGISLGGFTKDKAKEVLVSKIQEWNEGFLKIKSDDKNWEIPNKDLDVDFDIEQTIEDVFKESRKGNLGDQFFKRFKIVIFGFEKPLFFTSNNVETVLNKILREADIQATNAGLKIENGKILETKEKTGRKVNLISLRYSLFNYIQSLSNEEIFLPQYIVYSSSNQEEIEKIKDEVEEILKLKIALKAKNKKWEILPQDIQKWLEIKNKPLESIEKKKNIYHLENYLREILEKFKIISFLNEKLEIDLKEEKVLDYLKEISKEINKPAKNAILGIENEKVVVLTPEENGEELDLEISKERILNSLKKKESIVFLPTKIIKAQVRKDNIKELGIIELISRGQSDFSGSSTSRKHNIKIGTSKFNGVLIAPGEIFSFNKYLGPVDASGGFLPELVIKPEKLVKEYGGGLCQVATTAFRAALYAGVPILERKNHAFAVHYYDWPFSGPGVDATVYPPHPDLRFKNDTGKYILIQTFISGNKLIFDFYGTKGNRKITLEGPLVTSRNSDGSMTTVLYRYVYEGELLKRKDTFTSYYRPASEYPKVEEPTQ